MGTGYSEGGHQGGPEEGLRQLASVFRASVDPWVAWGDSRSAARCICTDTSDGYDAPELAEVAEALEARREMGKKKSDPRGDVSFTEEREARRELGLDLSPSTWKQFLV